MQEKVPGELSKLIVTGLFLWCLSMNPVNAQTLGEAACYIFDGKINCLKVKVTNRDECTVKLYPREIKSHDPEIAGCLIDDLQTKTISFKKLTEIDFIRSSSFGHQDGDTHLKLSGEGAIFVLSAYNEHGGPEWTPVDRIKLPIKGDFRVTKRMMHLVQQNLCSGQSKIARSDHLISNKQSESGQLQIISAEEAHTRLERGQLVLIDIRRPSEWRETGIAQDAVPISMHQTPSAFLQKLRDIADREGRKPLALICATGSRSAYMTKVLGKLGFSNILDVQEGMLGNAHGKCWISAGLPVVNYSPQSKYK